MMMARCDYCGKEQASEAVAGQWIRPVGWFEAYDNPALIVRDAVPIQACSLECKKKLDERLGEQKPHTWDVRVGGKLEARDRTREARGRKQETRYLASSI